MEVTGLNSVVNLDSVHKFRTIFVYKSWTGFSCVFICVCIKCINLKVWLWRFCFLVSHIEQL
jgi:hypothetical protein